jgi:hypothetical protein
VSVGLLLTLGWSSLRYISSAVVDVPFEVNYNFGAISTFDPTLDAGVRIAMGAKDRNMEFRFSDMRILDEPVFLQSHHYMFFSYINNTYFQLQLPVLFLNQ